MATLSRYIIKRADLNRDREGILKVLVSNFQDFNPARYDWLYLDNPCGQAHTFAARSENGPEIIGCVSIFPRRMIFSGRQYLAGIVGDFAVAKSIRGFLGFQLQRKILAHARDNFDFLYSIPNPQSEGVLERIGFITIGKISRLAKVLRADEKLKSKTNPVLAKLGAPLVNLYLKSKLNRQIQFDPLHYNELCPAAFDERFTEFWKKNMQRPGIIGLRDENYLCWKYGRSPYFQHKIFALTDKDSSQLTGYIVYHIIKHLCLIDDLQCLSEPACHQLIGQFFRSLCKQELASIVSLFLADTMLYENIVKALGFSAREQAEKLIIYIPPQNEYLKAPLMDFDNWHIFKGDWDI